MDSRVPLSYPLPPANRTDVLQVRESSLQDAFDLAMRDVDSVDALLPPSTQTQATPEQIATTGASGYLPLGMFGRVVANQSVVQTMNPGSVVHSGGGAQILAALQRRINSCANVGTEPVLLELVDEPSGIVDIKLSRNPKGHWIITLGVSDAATVSGMHNALKDTLIEHGVMVESLHIEQRYTPTGNGGEQ